MDIVKCISLSELRWAEYVARMPDKRPVKLTSLLSILISIVITVYDS